MKRKFLGVAIPDVNLKTVKGTLVVVEGGDGAGRSTQISLLDDALQRQGYPTVQVGLKRSSLVAADLQKAMQTNLLRPKTLALLYATDFADQLENVILPALRSDFVVLADRYIYTLMARSLVRSIDLDWVKNLYSIAIAPDIVFFLDVPPKVLAERNFIKHVKLDYWESGLDIETSENVYRSFLNYQAQTRRVMKRFEKQNSFQTIDGVKDPLAVHNEILGLLETCLARS